MNFLEWIFKYLFINNKDKKIQYADYTLDELDKELGYDPFSIVVSELQQNFNSELYKKVLAKIHSKRFEIPYKTIQFGVINNLLNQMDAFADYYNPRIPFDKNYAMIPEQVARLLLKVLSENIQPFHRVNDVAYTITAYNQIVTGLNWIGSANGYRHYNDGREEPVSFNVLIVYDENERAKILLYEPDKKRVSEDGKGEDYYIYSGGTIVWG